MCVTYLVSIKVYFEGFYFSYPSYHIQIKMH